jgi:hypothetical protein
LGQTFAAKKWTEGGGENKVGGFSCSLQVRDFLAASLRRLVTSSARPPKRSQTFFSSSENFSPFAAKICNSARFRAALWARCYDFRNIFTLKILAKILAFFAQTTASFCKNLIITLFFEKNAIFSQKMGANRRKL